MTQQPKTISELRKQLAIKTAPNHNLLDLYRRDAKEALNEQAELLTKWKEALEQIAGLSDISPLKESELMRNIAKKALEFNDRL